MKYLLISVNKYIKNEPSNSKYRSIKKGENKIVKILAKSKVEIYLNLDLENFPNQKISFMFKILL